MTIEVTTTAKKENMMKKINAQTFNDAREALRDGKKFLLLCIEEMPYFTDGEIYPVVSFDNDCNIKIVDNDGDEQVIYSCGKNRKFASGFRVIENDDDAILYKNSRNALIASDLKYLLESFSNTSTFKRGDLIVWKDGLKDVKMPEYGIPAIVIDVLDVPVKNPEKHGSHYNYSSLDIVIGIKDDDLGFAHFHADSRRFKLWDGN